MLPRLVEAFVPARLGGGYRWLLASSWVAALGDGVGLASGPLLVASLTSDPVLVALAALLRWVPPMVFGLVAGVLSDRVDRRRLVMTADASRAATLAVLVSVLATGRLTVTLALAALAALATADVFSSNASLTLAPMLVAPDDLALANARLQTGFLTLSQLAGPPLGAALFAAGRASPFVTEGVLVCAGVALVARVALPPLAPADAGADGVRGQVAEGVRWTLRHPAVRTLALTILAFNVTYGAAFSVLVLYAQQRLGLGAFGYGLLATVTAVGGLIGTGLYGWITRRVSLGNVMRVGLVIETLTHLALALTTSPWLASGVFVVFGAHAFIWGTTAVTVRQRAVPVELQGRVGGVYVIGMYGGLVVGSALGGPLAARWGVTAPFWFAFAGSAVLLALLWRELTRIAHDPAAAAGAA